MLEPLGVLAGRDAAAAITAGVARPLAGGPRAFILVRSGDRVLPACDAEAIWPEAMAGLSAELPDWAGLGKGPLIMGVLNVTPDSFSDGGDRLDPAVAIAAGERMLAEGANIIDVGGESTRPGASPASLSVEQARIIPVIEALARAGAVISVDTRNADTMRRALACGARIVNDVTALRHDPAALPVVAQAGCPVVLMHMRGTPATMMGFAHYEDVAEEVCRELADRIAVAEAGGVLRTNIAVDPGFGFAKGLAHNTSLLHRLPSLLGLGCAIVAGLSRKATIGALTGEADPKSRGTGSAVAAVYALARGARIVRVHDVRETRQAIAVWRAADDQAGMSALG